eukprot:36532_1
MATETESVAILVKLSETEDDWKPDPMIIYVSINATVQSIKYKIQELKAIRVQDQILSYGHKQLKDTGDLRDYTRGFDEKNAPILSLSVKSSYEQKLWDNSIKDKDGNSVAVDRISNVLNNYYKYIQMKQNKQSTGLSLCDFLGDCSNERLVDDFMTLQLNKFEKVYNILNKKCYGHQGCNILECLSMERNGRNRGLKNKNKNKLKELYFGTDDIVTQQILDKIHCYYFHSFDIGMKIKETELNIINQIAQ